MSTVDQILNIWDGPHNRPPRLVTLRVILVEALGAANVAEQEAKRLAASPFSSESRFTALHEIRGYQRGLAKAIELLDLHELRLNRNPNPTA